MTSLTDKSAVLSGDEFPLFGEIAHHSYIRPKVLLVASRLREQTLQAGDVAFDPYICARAFGIIIRETQLSEGLSGRLRFHSGEPVIDLRSADSRPRKRFTASHELGHLCFRNGAALIAREGWLSSAGTKAYLREEQICNRIATELLMPESAVLRTSHLAQPGLETVRSLAAHFEVSIAAMLRRLQELRVWSISVGTWAIQRDGTLGDLKSCRTTIRRGVRHRHDKTETKEGLESFLRSAGSVLGRALVLGDEPGTRRSTTRYRSLAVEGRAVTVLPSDRPGRLRAFVAT